MVERVQAGVVMNLEERRALPWWLLPHALGLDVAFAVCMWTWACVEGLQASLAGSGVCSLLVVGAWLSVMVPRLMSKTSLCSAWHPVYRLCLWIVALGAELWLIWMMLYEMGAGILMYVSYAVALLCWSLCFRWRLVRSACWSWALVIMCYGPVINYTMTSYNGALLFYYLSIWGMAGVFFLFLMHRLDEHKGKGLFLTITSTLILLMALLLGMLAPAEEKSISWLLAMGVSATVILRWFVRGRGASVCEALDWPVMGLAAAAYLCIFAV